MKAYLQIYPQLAGNARIDITHKLELVGITHGLELVCITHNFNYW